MGHDNLKNALQHAGITPEEFADTLQVDPKSVLRWLAGTTTPYRRHRIAIARALALTEHELWPDQAPEPGPGLPERDPITQAGIVAAWAYATDYGAPDPVDLITNSDGAIDLLDGYGIELTAALLVAIVEQADTGRRVRLLTSRPKPPLKPLIEHQQIEIRVIDAGPYHSLVCAGDTMLLTFNLAGEADQAPPLLKLERAAAGALFQRLADNFEALWDDADETITGPGQLAAYLTNTDEDDDDFDEARAQTPTGPSGHHEPPALATESVATPAPADLEQAPRRWPRRPE